jgi:hypothetical protein
MYLASSSATVPLAHSLQVAHMHVQHACNNRLAAGVMQHLMRADRAERAQVEGVGA